MQTTIHTDRIPDKSVMRETPQNASRSPRPRICVITGGRLLVSIGTQQFALGTAERERRTVFVPADAEFWYEAATPHARWYVVDATTCPRRDDAPTCEFSLQRRYRWFLRDHADCSGRHNMEPYMRWNQHMSSACRRQLGLHRFAPLPSDVFDVFLERRSRSKVVCDHCFGDGHWHGETCRECAGTGRALDECHPNVWDTCPANTCMTDDEWRAQQDAPVAAFDQTFDDGDIPW